MGFLDNLRRQETPTNPVNPMGPMLGGRPVSFGNAQELPMEGILSRLEPFIARQRTANLEDLRSQQNILGSGPGVQEGRIRQIANPNQGTPNVIYDPGITDFQKASLGQNQQQIDLEKRKAGVSERVGDEKVGLVAERLKLDQDKNQNIYDTKQREIEQRAEIAERTAAIARERIAAGENSVILRDQYQRAESAARDARHALDISMQERRADDAQRLSDARIEQIRKAMDEAGYSIEETDVTTDPSTGNQKRVTVTKKGSKPAETKSNDPLGLRK